jgi:hypothetical protein
VNIQATNDDLLTKAAGNRFRTILVDPPWRFINRTGKVAPEHLRLARYETLSTDQICELPVSDIIIDHFKKLHGDKYWNQIGTPQMRVKAYERQQSDEPEKQLDIEAYLDFIDKKKIIEKQENWEVFKQYFNIPFAGEKGQAKNLRWMDRLNELRRVVAHSHKRAFKSDDLDFLEWIREEFEKRLLEAT